MSDRQKYQLKKLQLEAKAAEAWDRFSLNLTKAFSIGFVLFLLMVYVIGGY
jgi:hypothetical protein